MNQIKQNILRHVEEIGWSIMSAAPRADSLEPREWWSYTIGLPTTFGWPEIIIFGLKSDVARDLLNDLVFACRDKKINPQPNVMIDDVVRDFPIKLVDGSHIPQHYLNYARWFAEQKNGNLPVDCLQFVWTDKSGYFPDEDSCNPDVRLCQMPLEGYQ